MAPTCCTDDRKVVLIGTRHDFHIPPKDAPRQTVEAFKAELRRVVAQSGARAIAEEAPPDFVAFLGIENSSPHIVASELELPYLQLDLTEAERDAVGIYDSGKARMIAFQEGMPETWEIEQKIRCTDVRETEWVRRLAASGVYPVVAVCGARHIESLSKKLGDAGLGVSVANPNWADV